MSNSDNGGSVTTGAMRAVKIMALGLLLLAVPATVFSGLQAPGKTGGPEALVSGKTGAAKARQHLRCWQYGQLIFEENQLIVPPESMGRAIRMRKATSDSSVYLFDTNNATCLIDSGPEFSSSAARP